MVDIKITWSGDLVERMKSLSVDAAVEVDKALKIAALSVESEVKKKLQRGSAGGRLYRRRSITHRASAPGQPPKTDTGRLVGSISHNFTGFLEADVGSDVSYAKYLENGTSKMAARPYLAPTLAESESKINDFVMNALKKAFK